MLKEGADAAPSTSRQHATSTNRQADQTANALQAAQYHNATPDEIAHALVCNANGVLALERVAAITSPDGFPHYALVFAQSPEGNTKYFGCAELSKAILTKGEGVAIMPVPLVQAGAAA